MFKIKNAFSSLSMRLKEILPYITTYYLPHWFEELKIWSRRIFDRIKHNRYVLLGLMIFFLAFLCFATTYLSNMFTVPMGGDYVLQIIPFAFNAWDDWHYFFDTGVFPLWDTSGMLGVNNIGAYSFYNLSSPWTMIYLLFPRSWVPQIQGILQMVKITTGGLLFYCYLSSFNLRESTKKIGAVAFAFCGFVFYNLWFHFLDVVCFLPLLLWGIERVLQKKGPFTLILSLVLIGFTNYFFLICFCTSSMVYVFFRAVQTWKTRTNSATLRVFSEGVIGYLTGIFIVSIILFPSLVVGLEIAQGRNGTNYFTALQNAKNLGEILKLIFVFPKSYEASFPLSSFFLMNINCFSSNIYRYRGGHYNNTMSSIFVFTPMMLMLVPSILDSIKTKKWSHLIGCLGTILMLFTPFCYYIFFGGSALYGRWEIMTVCWMLVFFLIHFERHKEMPKSYMDISIIFSVAMMVLAYFIADKTQKANPDLFSEPDGRNSVVIYQILYTVICFIVMRVNFRKAELSKYVLLLVAIEAVIQGNVTIIVQGVQKFQNLAGGIDNVNQETEIVSSLNDYDPSFFRLFSSTADRGANNNQMRVGYNGIGTFNTNYDKNLDDLLVWSRINYNKSWSMSVNAKRYNLDTLIGVKYYLLKEDDINIPFGFVDMATLDSSENAELTNLQTVLSRNNDNHRLYLNTRYVDTFFTYDTLINSKSMNGSESYAAGYEDDNEMTYLKYGILDKKAVQDLKNNNISTYHRLSGSTDTLADSNSKALYSSAKNILDTSMYQLEIRYPNWSSSGHIVASDGKTEISLPDSGFTPTDDFKFESDQVYKSWSDINTAHSKTNIGTDGQDQYVINKYMPYWTRIYMTPNSPVCAKADPSDPTSGCYVNISARSGYSINFYLLDENNNIITNDYHYDNTYGGENDWQYSRGFYVDRPVHEIVGFVMKDIKPTMENTGMTDIFPKPIITSSPYSDYIADTNKLSTENQHFRIIHRDANTLNFTTDFTKEKLHFTVMNIPYDTGWNLTRTMKKDGVVISEKIPTYISQGGLTGFEAINSNSENETISYSFSYCPEGLGLGKTLSIIGLLMLYSLSLLYMGLHLNSKFFKYNYLNLRTNWYDKDVWEKNNKIKRRYKNRIRR